MEYKPKSERLFPALKLIQQETNLVKRISALLNVEGRVGNFYQKLFAGLFAYAVNRIPEISASFGAIDMALKAGFGWELGVFELWDKLGFEKGKALIDKYIALKSDWFSSFIQEGFKTFYEAEANGWLGKYFNKSGSDDLVLAKFNLVSNTTQVWTNSDVNLVDIGDGILKLSFQTKMNVMGGGVMEGIAESIAISENHFEGIVIANEGDNFSLGAN